MLDNKRSNTHGGGPFNEALFKAGKRRSVSSIQLNEELHAAKLEVGFYIGYTRLLGCNKAEGPV
jgi:hypothetical protein